MALPSKVNWVTFDVYGTLIDWEKGVADAFEKEAKRDGFTIDRDEVIRHFHEISREIEGGSYELYAEVLRRTAVEIAKRIDWPLEPCRSGFLPDSVARWAPFKETNAQLQQVRQRLRDRPDLEHRRQAARPDAPPHPARLRPRRHRAAGALLQARPRALQRVRAPDRHQEGLGARRVELLPRRRAVHQAEGPGDLGQPQQGDRSSPARRSRPPRSRRSSRRPSCSGCRAACGSSGCIPASSSRRRASSRPTCTIVRDGDECFVVDSPVLPDELDVAAGAARAGGLPVQRPARHARRLGPPAGPAGVPGRGAGRRGDDGGAADGRAGRRGARLRAFDDELYLERPAPLSLGQVQALPVPGKLDVGEQTIELHPTEGHVPTAWRCGSAGRGCSSPATSSRRSRSRCSARAARAARTSRRSSACARSSSRPTTSSRATAGRSTAGARCRSCARTSPTSKACPLAAADRAAQRRAEAHPRREPGAAVTLQHAALETRPADADALVAFFALLGFDEVEPPASLRGRTRWVQRGATQIHLLLDRRSRRPARRATSPSSRPTTRPRSRRCAPPATRSPTAPSTGARRAPSPRAPGGHRVEVISRPPG